MKIVPVAYLTSYALSVLGGSVAAVVLPLVVLASTGSVLGAGVVAAATAVPAFVVGLFAGVVVDRVNRRTVSVVSDVVSALALAALPVVDLVWGLGVGWFVLLGAVGALGDVPGMTARETLLAAVVRHSGARAERLVGLRESIGAVSVLVGPALAGVLVVLLDGATALWVTSATLGLAALATLLMPRAVGAVERSGTAGQPVWRTGLVDLRDGWRVLVRSPFLVVVTAISTTSLLVLAAFQGLLLPVHFTALGRPELLGAVLPSIAAGLLVGGVLFAVLGHRGRRRAWFGGALVGSAVGIGVVAALPPLVPLLGGGVVLGLASGCLGGLTGVLMVERVPEVARGRVFALQNCAAMVAAPVGIMGAALLVEGAGLGTAALVVASPWLLAVALGVLAPATRDLGRRPEVLGDGTVDDGTARDGTARDGAGDGVGEEVRA